MKLKNRNIEKRQILLIILFIIIAIIQALFYTQNMLVTTYPDTVDYKDTTSFSLSNLQDRTPVYPLIIDIAEFVFGETYGFISISIMQIIVSFISLIYLYKTLKLVITREYIVYFITFFYGIAISIIGWNTVILTESLALSWTIFFIYNIFKYLKEGKLRNAIFAIILSLLITFLKPACINYPVLLGVFFILKFIIEKDKRKETLKSLIISLISILLILIYAIIFYMQHGIFSISKASLRQNLYICIEQRFFLNSKNEEFQINVIKNMLEGENMWDAVYKTMDNYDVKELQKLIKESKNNSRKEYSEYVVNLIKKCANMKFGGYYKINNNQKEGKNIIVDIINKIQFLKFWEVYMIIIIEGCVFIYKWIKNKKINWINLGLLGFMLTILIVTFVGTNAEFMRTAICIVPFSYIAIAIFINDLIEVGKKRVSVRDN